MTITTTHPTPLVSKGFLLASAYNVAGMLIFSQAFTNSRMTALDPDVFSWIGMVAVVLWGCAYGAVAQIYQRAPYLVLLFGIEKLIYTGAWLSWMGKHASRLPGLFSESPLTALFFAIYGVGDFVFAVFFLWVAVRVLRERGD